MHTYSDTFIHDIEYNSATLLASRLLNRDVTMIAADLYMDYNLSTYDLKEVTLILRSSDITVTINYVDSILHNADLPSINITNRYSDIQLWFYNDKPHRLYGPWAVYTSLRDNSEVILYWGLDGNTTLGNINVYHDALKKSYNTNCEDYLAFALKYNESLTRN